MDDEVLKQQWRDLAKPWILESREGKNPTRNGLLDQPMLEQCGDVAGLRALDCGCGEGRFCRILVERGAAYVLGVDLCQPMIDAARELQTSNDDYQLGDVQDLSFLEAESFDLAVSYLNQCDLADFDSNTREVFRVLKPGGRFVVANLHPMNPAVGTWHTENDERQHVILDRYFDERPIHWTMMGVEFTNFHRTLTTYLSSFFEAGFMLERLVEPTITQQQLADFPTLGDELRVPTFVVYNLRKLPV